ncbi:MAG TPA: GntR family transcriptional regulator [Rhodothermales bacterium]|nr:GntR family transcriptional regulator [Rhodothermales bacterium]
MEVLPQARHEQVADWLRNQISSGLFAANAQLPSESEICRRFDVSRVTVRHALRTLENESLIYRRQGVGSFVKPHPVRQPLMRVTDFAEDMAAAGMRASSRVLRFGREKPPIEISQTLQQDTANDLVRLDRIRLGDNRPIAFDTTWLPLMYGQFLDQKALETRTLFQILEEQYGIEVVSGRYQIEAIFTPPAVARHLKIPESHPVLYIRRTVFTHSEKPVYVQDRFYNNKEVAYCMLLERVQSGLAVQEFQPLFKQ